MAVSRDPAEIVANLRGSIEASQRGSRKLRAHRFKDLFGFPAWSPARRKMISKRLADEGIVVQPPLDEAGRDDWLVFSMPTLPEVRRQHAEPRPSDATFAYWEKLNPGSELEVEMHFAAPLFQALGYTEEQEAAGFGITVFDGASHHRSEADLVYFATGVRDVDDGERLVLVECKMPGKGPNAGLGQVQKLRLHHQACLLRDHRSRQPGRVELPGRSGSGCTGNRGQERTTARAVRRSLRGAEPQGGIGGAAR
jgi:hypothetical protein